MLVDKLNVKDGRVVVKDSEITMITCPNCSSTFSRDFVRSKMKWWGKDKNSFYTTWHCPNCNNRVRIKDANAIVIIGYEEDRFIIEDPALNNEKGFIRFDDFNIRWRGYGKTSKEKLVNYGIAIIGKPEFKEK